MKVDGRKFVNAYFPWNEDLAREAKSEKPHYEPVKEKPVEMANFEYSIEIACSLDELNAYQIGAFSLGKTKEEVSISSWTKSQNDKGFAVLTASVKVNEPKALTRDFFISSGHGSYFYDVKPVKKGSDSSSESFVPIKPSIQIYDRLSWPKVGFFYHFINDELENEYQLSGGDKWSFKVTYSKGNVLSNELLSEHEYAFILLPWKINNTVMSRQHLLYTKEKITAVQLSEINDQWLDDNARLINPEDATNVRNDEKVKRETHDNGRVSYTVKAGDTLSSIAKKQGVKYDELLALNPQITDPNLIQVGDIILIKEEKPEQERVLFHICKINPETGQRETWAEIAAQYGMTARALFDLNADNPIFKDGALALGDELRVNQNEQIEEEFVFRNAQCPIELTNKKWVYPFSNIWSLIEKPYTSLAYMFAQDDTAVNPNTAIVNVQSVLLHSSMLSTSDQLELIAQGKSSALKKGDKGNEVKIIQKVLLSLNFDLGKFGADGDFGDGTHQAVMDFQRNFKPTNEIHSEYGLKDPDGIVGSQTLFALDEAIVNKWISEIDDMDDKWLVVPFGQVTFDAEGTDDNRTHNFSRVIHWPGNSGSGVTIGRGYDCGNRSKSEVYEHMINAQLPTKYAELVSNSAGLKGDLARDFVSINQKNIGEISRKSQHLLFISIYPIYIKRAKINYEKWTSGLNGVAWENLDIKIRDIAVDFVYQGFTKGGNPMTKCMLNDNNILIQYIETNSTLKRYEAGRQRANYLRDN